VFHDWIAEEGLIGWTSVGRQCLDQPCLGRRQQLREHSEIIVASRSELECGVHVDPGYVTARRQPHLPLAGDQHVRGFMLLATDQSVLAVGATLSIGSGFAPAAGNAVVAAGPAVFGPSAWLDVPAAEGPDNDMDVSRVRGGFTLPRWHADAVSGRRPYIRFLPRSAAPGGA
jgi:hypothetical protein